MLRSRPLFVAAAFAIAAASTRFAFPKIESRVQIVGFWAAALVLQLVARPRSSALALMLNGTAATLAIIAVKVALEGLPPAIAQMLGG